MSMGMPAEELRGIGPVKCKDKIAFLLLPLRAHAGSLSPRRVESWFVNSSPSWMRLSGEVPHSLLRTQGLTSHPEFVSLPPLLFISSSWGVFPMPTLLPPALFEGAGAFSTAAVTSSQVAGGRALWLKSNGVSASSQTGHYQLAAHHL